MEVSVSPLAIDGTPYDDLAASRTLLERVAAGSLDSALRIWRPVPAIAFSKLDLLGPGAQDALAVAQRAGLPVVQRMSGGHAVIVGAGSLAIGLAEPARAFEATRERYERMSDAIVGALAVVGIEAEPGELPREWCPGTWSIHAGPAKLAGLSQRVVRGAAWTEAVIQLEPGDAPLWEAVYAALELPLDPRTLGAAGVGFDELAQALRVRLMSPHG